MPYPSPYEFEFTGLQDGSTLGGWSAQILQQIRRERYEYNPFLIQRADVISGEIHRSCQTGNSSTTSFDSTTFVDILSDAIDLGDNIDDTSVLIFFRGDMNCSDGGGSADPSSIGTLSYEVRALRDDDTVVETSSYVQRLKPSLTTMKGDSFTMTTQDFTSGSVATIGTSARWTELAHASPDGDSWRHTNVDANVTVASDGEFQMNESAVHFITAQFRINHRTGGAGSGLLFMQDDVGASAGSFSSTPGTTFGWSIDATATEAFVTITAILSTGGSDQFRFLVDPVETDGVTITLARCTVMLMSSIGVGSFETVNARYGFTFIARDDTPSSTGVNTYEIEARVPSDTIGTADFRDKDLVLIALHKES